MKTVMIELPENYDECMSFTLVGRKGITCNVLTHCFDLSKGRDLFLDKEKLKNGEVFYIQV